MDIVIIDDEPVNLTVIKQVVGRVPQCYAQAFTQPAAALAWCKANEPDLVIVGYVMPDFNGIRFTQQLRALDGKAETPVLMVTASTDPNVRSEALSSGINDVLTKPFDSAELQERVKNMLVMRSTQKKSSFKASRNVVDTARSPAVSLQNAQPEHAKRWLNVDMTLTRLAGDHVLFSEIARVFLRTAPDLVADARAALSANNMERLSAEAHSLKGAVAAFEAPEVYSAVALVQTHADKHDRGAAASAFEAAQSLIHDLIGELSSIARRDAAA